MSDGATESSLLEAVEEAVGAHVIEEVAGSTDRYQFSHALIQQTLAEEVTTSRRVRLHARIGEGLEQLYAADAESHAVELVHHFAEAEPVLGTEKLTRYSLMAGERALSVYAYEQASDIFQRALAMRE